MRGPSFDNSSVTQLCQDGPKTTDTMAAILMVAGVVAIGVLLTLSIRGKIARRNAQRPTGRELIDQVKRRVHAAGRGQDVAEQTAEMVETARRLAAQLDNKAKRLEILIEEADRRLEAMGGTATAGPPRTTPEADTEPSHRPEPEDAAPDDPPVDPLTRAVYELADQGRNAIDIARELDEQVGKIELILALRAA